MLEELHIENLERLPYVATFTKVELVLKFMPGHGGRGAIVKDFLHAIHDHDQVVHEVEEQWLRVDTLQKDYNRINKVYRNMEIFYYTVNTNPSGLSEFEELLPRMNRIKERLAQITDVKVRASVVEEYRRFRRKQKKYTRVIALRSELLQLKDRRDLVQKELVEAQQLLSQLRLQEEAAANKISQDHMLANDQRISMHELFPNVHVGHILTEINEVDVENANFKEVLEIIRFSKSPHKCIFKRYLFSFNSVTGKWMHVKDKRAMNVYIEDPALRTHEFFMACKMGDRDKVSNELRAGADPNIFDATLTSALHVAAVNGHIEIIRLLVSSGARIDARDRNMVTPLLACLKKGLVEPAKVLLELGAEKFSSDRMQRSSAFFAAYSGCIELVKLFIDSRNCNSNANVWGLTPLHIAATRGDITLARYLLELESSIYIKDRASKTPEDLAFESKQTGVFELLREHRYDAPGQFVLVLEDEATHIWIGDHVWTYTILNLSNIDE